MAKLIISLGFFEDSESTKPTRVANISFDNTDPNLRVALKDAGLVIVDHDFPIDGKITDDLVNKGRELLYAPDKLVRLVLDFLTDKLRNRMPFLANILSPRQPAPEPRSADSNTGRQ